MFFRKAKKISEFRLELERMSERNNKYLREIRKRDETVCPMCVHSVEAYEKQKYRRLGDPVPYYNSEAVHVCRFNECTGFEPESENPTGKSTMKRQK